MRYIQFLVALATLVVATACVSTDFDDVTINTSQSSSGDLQVVGRITQFSDCDVATRSKKEGDEPKVTSMSLALFPIKDGAIGNCIYYDYQTGGSIVFVVERDLEVFNNYEGTSFAMYIFANMQDAEGFPTTKDAGVGKSLDYFTKCAAAASANVEDVPANGFPMMGSLGNTLDAVDGDGTTFILKPEKTGENIEGLPLIGSKPTDNLEIPLTALYAKFSFTISVRPDQEIVGNKAPRFDLLSYEVKNIAAEVDSNSSTNASGVIASSGAVSMGNYAQGATVAEFDFYLPERYLSPSKALEDVLPTELKKGTYGTDVDADQNGYRDEDERYHQRFKNLLPGTDQKATYVTINGKFTDHQGHTYDVAYNIYLGGNNYDNFDIIRNTHYDNSVTIRGISSSDDQATNEEAVSIDWRVNVERSTPLVINLRRESLLDAHYEVRPLRLRLVGENIPTGTSATVTILNEDGTTTNIPEWIRLEASGSSSDHITSGVSAGKRKYFTTDLVTNTLKDNTNLTVSNLTAANQTIWIYVDENTTTTSRAAIVRVSYNGVNKDYKIVQNGLYAVVTTRDATEDGVGGSYTYYIEQYEEYLYNYDAEDSYGQTEWNGMEWGWPGEQISFNDKAIYLSVQPTGGYSAILQYFGFGNFTEMANSALVENDLNPKYDFYIWRDVKDMSEEHRANLSVHNYDGYGMNKKMISKYPQLFPQRTLASPPESAVEYCYNRNKRKSDGTIDPDNIVWYMPSIDEIEDIAEFAHGSFSEFQGNIYWSCQPAYDKYNLVFEFWEAQSVFGSFSKKDDITGTYYIDNVNRARATRALRQNGQFTGVLNSGADIKGTQYGVLRLRSSLVAASKEYDHGENVPNQSFDATYKDYPGNLPRTGTKARVRCVRKM